MAQLRVFLSSTAYDLHLVRGHLREFLTRAGHQPVLSDFSDILYDPKQHTHKSCIQELESCDAVVLVIGSRLGSTARPEFVEELQNLSIENESIQTLTEDKNISVTQLEALTAFSRQIPVFTFVDSTVMSDFRVYQSNFDAGHAGSIIYPSIPDHDVAEYIFRFIKYIQERSSGNSLFTFEKIVDIESTLAKQWSSLLQRLLATERTSEEQTTLLAEISEQISDLKSAVITSIDSPEVREVARGVVQYRLLIDTLLELAVPSEDMIRPSPLSWNDLLRRAQIAEILERRETGSFGAGRVALVYTDNQVAILRLPAHRFAALGDDWTSFCSMSSESRKLIVDTLREQNRPGMRSVRRYAAGESNLEDYKTVVSTARERTVQGISTPG